MAEMVNGGLRTEMAPLVAASLCASKPMIRAKPTSSSVSAKGGLDWIAEKLAMRSAANVSQQLRRLDREKALSQLPREMRSFLEGARKSGT